MRKRKIRTDKVPATVDALLNTPFWLPTIKTQTLYQQVSDDNREAFLNIVFSMDGDAHINVISPPTESIRVRTYFGGGNSHRVRTALLILAEAIRLDNEENRTGRY